MATNIWKGQLSFGLVSVPVAMQSAVSEGDKVSFNEICPEHRCKAKRGPSVCTATGHTVPQVGKGYDAGGHFVVITKEDLDSVRVPSDSVLSIREFVRLEAIDPRYFDRPYWLVPDKAGAQSYALITEALRRTGYVGLGTITTRGRSNVFAVRAFADTTHLAIYALRYEDELIPESDLAAVAAPAVDPKLVTMAIQLIEAQAADFDPSKYENEYQVRLRAMVDAKAAGRADVEVPIPVHADTSATSLESVLAASLVRSQELLESLKQGIGNAKK